MKHVDALCCVVGELFGDDDHHAVARRVALQAQQLFQIVAPADIRKRRDRDRRVVLRLSSLEVSDDRLLDGPALNSVVN